MALPDEDQASPGDGARRLRFLLAAMVLVAFCPFAFAELFWDDDLVIRADGPIASLSTIAKAFTGRCVLFDPSYNYPYYRPFIDILFVIEYALVGKHPFLYHLTNFLLHLGNTLIGFELMRRLLPRGPAGPVAALAGAGIFALHPIQCESVLWAAARPAMLSGFFCLLGIMAYRQIAQRGAAFGVLAACGFIGGLFSKEIAVAVLPCALLLVAEKGTRLTRAQAFAAGALVAVLVAYLVLNRAAGDGAGGIMAAGLPAFARAVLQTFGFYLLKLVYPVGLMPSYAPDRFETTANLVVGAFGATILMAIALAGLARRSRLALLGTIGAVFFGGGAVLPGFGGQFNVADRYMYQAMWGLGLLVAVGVYTAIERRPAARGAVLKGTCVLLALVGLLALRQSTFWITSVSLWTRVVEVEPDSLNGNFYLGQHFERQGNFARAAEHLRIAAFTPRRVRKDAEHDAALALGRVEFAAGHAEEALKALDAAAVHPPLRGDATVRAAIVEFARGDAEAARKRLAQFTDDDRQPGGVYLNLALLALRMDDDREAARLWYAKARARGVAASAELDALQ
jgi:tetratricopeptide (TPR) repeat protein